MPLIIVHTYLLKMEKNVILSVMRVCPMVDVILYFINNHLFTYIDYSRCTRNSQ